MKTILRTVALVMVFMITNTSFATVNDQIWNAEIQRKKLIDVFSAKVTQKLQAQNILDHEAKLRIYSEMGSRYAQIIKELRALKNNESRETYRELALPEDKKSEKIAQLTGEALEILALQGARYGDSAFKSKKKFKAQLSAMKWTSAFMGLMWFSSCHEGCFAGTRSDFNTFEANSVAFKKFWILQHFISPSASISNVVFTAGIVSLVSFVTAGVIMSTVSDKAELRAKTEKAEQVSAGFFAALRREKTIKDDVSESERGKFAFLALLDALPAQVTAAGHEALLAKAPGEALCELLLTQPLDGTRRRVEVEQQGKVRVGDVRDEVLEIEDNEALSAEPAKARSLLQR